MDNIINRLMKSFAFFLVLFFFISCGGSGGSSSPVDENQAPVSIAGSDQKIAFNSGVVVLDGNASSDPDDDQLVFSWQFDLFPDGSTVSLQNNNLAISQFTPDLVGLYRIKLTVSDGVRSSDDLIDIDVAINTSPTASAGADQDVNITQVVTLDGSASIDPDNNILTYSWHQVAGYGPDVTGGSGLLTGSFPVFSAPAVPATLLFDLRVDDGFGSSFADRVQINVFIERNAAIFVSTTGDDSNPGTKVLPKLSIASALSLAESLSADIYVDSVADFHLSSPLVLVDGVSIYGGYDSSNSWQLYDTDKTIITSDSTTAISADNIVSQTVLSRLNVTSSAATNTGVSSYGIFANNSDGVFIDNCEISANTTQGIFGGLVHIFAAKSGNDGLSGEAGCEDASGVCNACSRPLAGTGGGGGSIGAGGNGGTPGHSVDFGIAGFAGAGIGTASHGLAGNGAPSRRGDWNPTLLEIGKNGLPGADGISGSGGEIIFGIGGYAPLDATDGSPGQHGGNAGGGGGGGGGDASCDSYGGGGGGGGGGGAAGLAGYGGQSAGSSIGLYLWKSDVTVSNSSTIRSAIAGKGGDGSSGQPGGAGGKGGQGGSLTNFNAGNPYGGASEQDDGSNGGKGGDGGKGGNGGVGGGGAGGSSISVLIGGDSVPIINAGLFSNTAGNGGSSSVAPGPDGISAATYTTN